METVFLELVVYVAVVGELVWIINPGFTLFLFDNLLDNAPGYSDIIYCYREI